MLRSYQFFEKCPTISTSEEFIIVHECVGSRTFAAVLYYIHTFYHSCSCFVKNNSIEERTVLVNIIMLNAVENLYII